MLSSFDLVMVGLMSLAGPTRIGLGVQCHNPPLPHQTLDWLAVHRISSILHPAPDPRSLVERAFEMHLIDPPQHLSNHNKMLMI